MTVTKNRLPNLAQQVHLSLDLQVVQVCTNFNLALGYRQRLVPQCKGSLICLNRVSFQHSLTRVPCWVSRLCLANDSLCCDITRVPFLANLLRQSRDDPNRNLAIPVCLARDKPSCSLTRVPLRAIHVCLARNKLSRSPVRVLFRVIHVCLARNKLSRSLTRVLY